jgi:processive 1,2-diacylglycerol beta-glucosyltransferase
VLSTRNPDEICQADAMSARKVLLLSVSAGAGHVRAAEALRASAQIEFPGIEALHLDVMDYASATFRRLYTDAYIKLVNKHPALWGMLYQITADAKSDATMNKVRRSIERMNTRALRKRIAEFAPEAIICTHFLPAEILMHEIRRARLHVPVWLQVTDFDLHRMWVIPHMTGYFAANAEIGFRMRAVGLADSAVHVVGIPIMPVFSQPLDRATCAQQLGMDPQRRILLLMGGGAGVGNLEQVATHLLGLDADFQLIVLAGKNAAALAALQSLARKHPSRLFPQGHTNQIERLMACADLVITKPGGLTTSECLAMGVPMIVHSPIPGQEERNADYLLEQGAALKAVDTVGLEYRVAELLASPARIAQLRERARALARPHAARDVLRIVLGTAADTSVA